MIPARVECNLQGEVSRNGADGPIMLNTPGMAASSALGMGNAHKHHDTQKCIKRKVHVRNKTLTALLVSVTAGATSAQVIGSSGSETNELLSDPGPTLVAATSAGELTKPVLAGVSLNEQGTPALEPTRGEPLDAGTKFQPSDGIAVDGGVGWTFVLPDNIQAQREALFRKLDLMAGTKTRGSPVLFGIDREIKFVELQENQPGIPAPIGLSYPMPEQRVKFFGELTPILDPAPTTAMGWGGGIGIRFNF